MAQRSTRYTRSNDTPSANASVPKVRGESDGPRISRRSDLFGGGETGNLLQGRFQTERVYAWFQTRHNTSSERIDDDHSYHYEDHSWKVPYGVRQAFKTRLNHSQIASKYPWYVTWRSPYTHIRYRKRFMTLISAIHFIATRAQYVDSKACVVSKHGYDIPTALVNKLPKPWLWCPLCMQPRRFHAVVPEVTFWAQRKVWEKNKYIFIDQRVRLIKCSVCDCTNRNYHFRRSNQPWEIRRFRQGAMRARRRKRSH